MSPARAMARLPMMLVASPVMTVPPCVVRSPTQMSPEITLTPPPSLCLKEPPDAVECLLKVVGAKGSWQQTKSAKICVCFCKGDGKGCIPVTKGGRLGDRRSLGSNGHRPIEGAVPSVDPHALAKPPCKARNRPLCHSVPSPRFATCQNFLRQSSEYSDDPCPTTHLTCAEMVLSSMARPNRVHESHNFDDPR